MFQGARRAWLAPLALLLLLTLGVPPAPAAHDDGSGPRSLGGITVPTDVPALVRLEAEDFAEKPVGALVQDAEATGGTAWRMPEYGLISTPVDVPETGVVWVRIRARGEHPPGLMTTHMHPVVDGEQRGEWDVGPKWVTYVQSIPILAGRHVLSVDNFNNYHAPAQDRTLVVDWMEVTRPTLEGSPRVGQWEEVVVDGPEVQMAGTGVAQRQDEGARDATSWHMWGVGCFVQAVVFDHPGEYVLQATLRGNERRGEGSHTTVLLDGTRVDEFFVGDAWTTRETRLQAPGGASVIEICYDNDHGGDLKRNLWLDEMRVRRVGDAPPPATTPATPTPATPATPTTTTMPTATTPGGSPPAASTPGVTPTSTPDESTGGGAAPGADGAAQTPLPGLAWVLAALGAAAWACGRRR